MSHLSTLVAAAVGQKAAATILDVLDIAPPLAAEADGPVSRAVFAMAMNAVLFHDIMGRVPLGAAYVTERRAAGHKVLFDHGALRTIHFGEGPTGALPAGHLAFARILEPLGYHVADLYPLERLKMTGRAFAHLDHPEAIPQFFVSELHVDRFSPAFQVIAHAVFDQTADVLGAEAARALAAFATEGQAFNHATDRVPDVEAVAEGQKALGRPVKDAVEVSASGRVRQTAFKAQPVERTFVTDAGEVVRTVPGSFHEFISRDRYVDEAGVEKLDLRFDSSNAQGIFKMTRTG